MEFTSPDLSWTPINTENFNRFKSSKSWTDPGYQDNLPHNKEKQNFKADSNFTLRQKKGSHYMYTWSRF